MGGLNARLEQDKGIRLAVRIGIHTGLVVVGEIGKGASQEHLAWAVGKTNDVLYQQLNAVLAGWKRSGHLQTLFKRWLTVRLQ